jgi:hypothetical protein
MIPLTGTLAALDLDSVVKLAVLAALTPFWWPILKALYAEVQEALWREGGLFGRALGAAEVARLEDEHRGRHVEHSALVSEPWSRRVGRPARPGGQSSAVQRSGRGSPGATAAAAGRLRPLRRRGYR